jgi:hypothetical protein
VVRTESYFRPSSPLPKSSGHILAQFNDQGVIVYQAYRPQVKKIRINTGEKLAGTTRLELATSAVTVPT